MKGGSAITPVEMDDEYPVFGGNAVRGRFSAYNHEGTHVLIGRQGASVVASITSKCKTDVIVERLCKRVNCSVQRCSTLHRSVMARNCGWK
jgi:hypothetical protein